MSVKAINEIPVNQGYFFYLTYVKCLHGSEGKILERKRPGKQNKGYWRIFIQDISENDDNDEDNHSYITLVYIQTN